MRFVVDGVAYARPTHTTFAQDIYLMEQVRAAGLDKLQAGAHETPRTFVDRMQRELAPVLLPIMAGLLVPDGAAWTRDVAMETERALGATTDPAAKALLRAESAQLLAHFFATGIASARISPSSSGEEALPKESEEPVPTETGRASSG